MLLPLAKRSNKNRKSNKKSLRTLFLKFQYANPNTTLLRTRKIVEGLGAQKFKRRAQAVLLAETIDLDIWNSVFALLSQLIKRLGVAHGGTAYAGDS